MPSRRQFLAASAGTLAAPYLLSPRALARPGRPGANAQIAVGLVGMGKRALELLPTLLASPDCRVIWVCDVDTNRRNHAKSLVDRHYQNTDCQATNSYREMLSKDKVDAVVIATPDHWHVNHVVDSARARKDIYCEKPLTYCLWEGRLMMDAVRTHGVVFQTGSQQRTEYDGRFVTACEYVRSGRLGRLVSVNVGVGTSSVPCNLPEEPEEEGLDWNGWLGPAPMRPYNSALSPRGVHDHYPTWRLYREYSGGMLTDFGAHHFDIVQWALDMDQSGPIEVLPPEDPSSPYGARLFYANGIEVIHGGPDGVTFLGTRGAIHVSRDRLVSIPEKILQEPLADSDVHLPRHAGHVANWIECVKERKQPICNVEVGARSIACAHLCNLAYWHRRRFRWDPLRWTIPGHGDPLSVMDYQRREGFEVPAF
jgi:predicted dehydrogenase